MAKDTEQVVEVVFPGSNKTYSYIGSGNLRAGQHIDNAPVNHYLSGKSYTAPVDVVATHNVYGAKVGDKVGVSNGVVHSIPKPLKALPGNKELQLNKTLDIGGEKIKSADYMDKFIKQRQRLLGGNQNTTNIDLARQRLLGD